MKKEYKEEFCGKTTLESEEDYSKEQREKFVERMLNEGFIVIYPKNNELLIDLDTEEQVSQFERLITILSENYPELIVPQTIDGRESYSISWTSKGGEPGKHVKITLSRDLSPIERIAFQAALGSDPVRELLSLIRLEKRDFKPTLFVEDPRTFPTTKLNPEDYTCFECVEKDTCVFAFDPYNTNGDCLATK